MPPLNLPKMQWLLCSCNGTKILIKIVLEIERNKKFASLKYPKIAAQTSNILRLVMVYHNSSKSLKNLYYFLIRPLKFEDVCSFVCLFAIPPKRLRF